MKRSVGWGCLALVLGTSLVWGQGLPVVRVYDLRTLLLATGNMAGPSLLRLPLRDSCIGPAGEAYYRKNLGERYEPELSLPGKRVQKLVESHLLARSADPDAQVEVSEQLLRVTAPEPLQKEVAAFLGWLEGELTRSVTLQLMHLPAAAVKVESAPSLSRSEVAALLKEHPPISILSTSARLGATAHLRGSRREQTVTDQDVEVSEEAVISDPLVRSLFEGHEALVTAQPAAGGLFLAHLELRHARLADPPRLVDLSGSRIASIQTLRASSTLLAGSALVEPGGGLLVGHDADGDSVMLLRVIPEATPQPRPRQGASALLPLAELLDRQRRRTLPLVPGLNASGYANFDDHQEEHDDNLELVSHDEIKAWKLLVFPRDRPKYIQLWPLGARVLHQGTEEQTRTLAGIAAEWTKRLSGCARLELRVGRLPHGDEAAGEGTTDWTATAERLKTAAAGSCRLGDTLMIVGGEESSFIRDYDVEIAKKAVCADPIVDALFTGFGVTATCTRRLDGRLYLEAHFLYQAEFGRRRPYEAGQPEFGPIDLPVTAQVEARPRLTLEKGRWTLLARGPLAHSKDSVIALVRARW